MQVVHHEKRASAMNENSLQDIVMLALRRNSTGGQVCYLFQSSQAVQNNFYSSWEVTVDFIHAEKDQVNGHKVQKFPSVCVCHQ